MFSLLGDGDRGFSAVEGGGAKKGDIEEMPLNAGDSIGGLFDGCGAPSGRIHGPDDRFSTADNTGDVVCDLLFFPSSFLPSA